MRKYVFTERPTPAYARAVAALRALAGQNPEEVKNAFAEVAAEIRLREWERHYRLTKGHQCINRLRGLACAKNGPCIRPPGADHISLWIRDRRPRVYVFQPYELDWEDLQDLVEFCRHYGLQADITAGETWHFPGETMMVKITRREDGNEENGDEKEGDKEDAMA